MARSASKAAQGTEATGASVTPLSNPLVEKAAPLDPSKKAVLIVEDEPPLAHALNMKLKREGFETHTATNGTDALEMMKRYHYNIVLLDLIMPIMNGFSVLSELKQRGSTTPVIVLSNLGQEEDCQKAKSLGAIDYFVKSNTPIGEIIRRVKETVSLCS